MRRSKIVRSESRHSWASSRVVSFEGEVVCVVVCNVVLHRGTRHCGPTQSSSANTRAQPTTTSREIEPPPFGGLQSIIRQRFHTHFFLCDALIANSH